MGGRSSRRCAPQVRLLLGWGVALGVGYGAPAWAAETCYTTPFPVTNTGAISCIDATGATISGDIVNGSTGTITSTENNGILLSLGAVSGQISNAGAISVTAFHSGIHVDSSSV